MLRRTLSTRAQPAPFSFSFGGCGWCFTYGLGVAHSLRKHSLPIGRVAGASGGALVGTCLVTGMDPLAVMDFVRKTAARGGGLLGDMHETLAGGLESLLPRQAHELASGKLFVSGPHLLALSAPCPVRREMQPL
jgi:predicted acylesterase/phospholipase RssA